MDTTITNPERGQGGDSGEVDRRGKRPATRHHTRRLADLAAAATTMAMAAAATATAATMSGRAVVTAVN